MTIPLVWTQVNRAFSNEGVPINAAQVYFFENGTTTQIAVFSDPECTSEVSQPVLADENGLFIPLYKVNADLYRVDMKTAAGVSLPGYPRDDVVPFSEAGTAAATSFNPTAALPFTNVQDAIVGAGALSSDQTAIITRSLTPWTTGGTGNAFTITPSPVITGYSDQAFLVRFNRSNTGAATLNVNTLGARNLQKLNASNVATALAAGDVAAGAAVLAVYDGTRFLIQLGGSIEATIIGANVPAAGTFTSLTAVTTAGPTAASLKASTNASFVRLAGGNDGSAGANIELYGGTHATFANEAYYDAAQHIFRTQDGGTTIARVRSTGGVDGLFVGIASHIDPSVAEYGVTMTPEGALHIARLAGHPVNIKRSNSGSLVSFYIGTTQQGVISESGGTVTYGAFCGAHWSQFSDMSTPDVLPGTIFETIDEMCEWLGEENRTLAKARIARKGSRRAYGVFSHWDHLVDKDGNDVLNANGEPIRTSDFHLASLGAKFIRIAAGVVVQGEDLIESDDNGCGVVQADDIFRSSTVAKVTAGIAVETYADGSYLVPCTLHCG